MNDETNEPLKPRDEPLSAAMPDPAGPPRPVEAEDPVLKGIGAAGIALVTIGGLLLPLTVTTGATMGATQSAKIQWEQREAEIRQAAEQAGVDVPARQEQEPRDRAGN